MVRFKVFGLLILALMVGVLVLTSFTLGDTIGTTTCGGENQVCCTEKGETPCNTGLTCESNVCTAPPFSPTTPVTEPDMYGCSIIPESQCPSSNNILNVSSLTNAHGYEEGATQYTLCCNFFGSSSCSSADAVMYLSSKSNAHAEIVYHNTQCETKPEFLLNPISCSIYTDQKTCELNDCAWKGFLSSECKEKTCGDYENKFPCEDNGCEWHNGIFFDYCTGTKKSCEDELNVTKCVLREKCKVSLIPAPGKQSYTNPVCFAKGMQCVGETAPDMTSCPEELIDGKIFDIEVASLSAETNAHIGKFADYPVKICCSEFCEMYRLTDSCWGDAGMKCTWTPGRTKIYPEGGCCDDQMVWDIFSKTCVYPQGICNLVWMISQQKYPDSVQKVPEDLGYWNQYCASVNPGLNYGSWQEVNSY